MEPATERSYFTLKELFALIAIICLGLGTCVPFVRRQQEETNRAQCISNLKYLGLAIHNYHDIRREIVPSYLTDDHSEAAIPRDYATWPMILTPFFEGDGSFVLADLKQPLTS